VYRETSFTDGVTPRRGKSRSATSTPVLAIMIAAISCKVWAQTSTVPVELKPKQTQTFVIPLEKGQLAQVNLVLQGGIVAVTASSPDGKDRPLWPIDVGRGASFTYIVGGSDSGNYTLKVISYEREKLAELSVAIESPAPANQALLVLRDCEDALANAELLRRHWPGAPAGMDALKTYDQAFALASKLDNTPLKRLILTQKARFLIFRQNKFADAQLLLEQAVALRPADDAPEQALAWKTLSTVRYDLGEYQPAIEASVAALDLYRKTGDRYWQGIVLGNLSSDYAEIGQNTEALATAEEALLDAKEEHDPAGVVYCLSQLADLYRQQGDLEGAFRTFQQGLAWVKDVEYAPLVEAEIQKDLGLFYAQIGDWSQATEALNRCVDLEGKQNDPVSLEARGALATVMQHQGKLSSAVAEDTNAIEMARSLKLKQEEAELLLKRASVQLSLKKQLLAEADITAATKLASDLAALPLQIEASIAWGDARLAIDASEAAASYQEALQTAKQIGEREQQSVALVGLARAQRTQGKPEDAAISIEAALKILEASRGDLDSRELQVTYFAMHRNWYELAVDLCMELDRADPAKDYALRAFSYTERARARSLLDTLNSSGYSSKIPAPEAVREAYARNRQAVTEQQELLSHSTHLDSNEAAEKLQRLYREQEALESQMQSADDRLGSLLGDQTVDVAVLQHALLEEHAVLLSYWIGASQSYRWLVTSSTVSVDTLPRRSQLDDVITPLERMLRSRHPKLVSGEDMPAYAARQQVYEDHLQQALSRAGSMLLRKIPKGTHSIFVVGDGSLLSLPFSALRIPDGATTSYALRKYAFFLEPSASVAVYLKQHPPVEESLRIAVFADPVFSRNDRRLPGARNVTATAGTERVLFGDMPRLTGSLQEAREILRLAPHGVVALRTGFDANPDQVRSLSATHASILHFATHTVTVAGHPEISGIALSMLTREGKQQDGVFWLKDIYALHLPLSLVVLSGCGTDNMEDDPGEGLNSLAHAFFFSGVHSVVASLWSVDDGTTSQLMENFYRNLMVDHKRADEALRAAQLNMLTRPETSSPAAWAPFVLEGWPAAYGIDQKRSENVYSATALSTKRR
jgi:CHAT domain-containing protein